LTTKGGEGRGYVSPFAEKKEVKKEKGKKETDALLPNREKRKGEGKKRDIWITVWGINKMLPGRKGTRGANVFHLNREWQGSPNSWSRGMGERKKGDSPYFRRFTMKRHAPDYEIRSESV